MYRYLPLDTHIVERSRALKEKSDCTVKALAKVLNSTYDYAHFILKEKCQRVHGKGLRSIECLPTLLTDLQVRHKIGPYTWENRITIKRFCEQHPVGCYYVVVRGHALAVVDGVVFDHSDKSRRLVVWACRVHKD